MALGITGKKSKGGGGKKKPIGEQWQEMNREMVDHIRARRVDEAASLGTELVSFVDKHFRKNSPEKATTYNNMGMVFLMRREYDIAQECFSDALELRRKIFGNDHNEVAVILMNLSQLYRIQAQEIMAANRLEVEVDR